MAFERARFIKANRPFVWDYQEKDLAPMFRREFELGSFASAELSLVALGFGAFYLNGEKLTEDLFISPTSDYEKTLWYMTYDVTKWLRPGKNVLCCILGNGWYNESLKTPWEFRKAPWRDNPKVLLELTVDGEAAVYTDDSWLCKPESFIVFNQLRSGEHFDARLYDPRWTQLDASLDGWEPAVVDDAPPAGTLRPTPCPPIRELGVYPAVSCTKTGDKRYLFDIAQNISGYIRLTVCQKAGDVLTIRYGEQRNEDGSLKLNDMDTFYPESPFQTDVLTLGDGAITYSPMFAYHGFQFIEITGLDEQPALSDVAGVFTHLDVPQIAQFECSNADLNALFRIGVMACYSNLHYTLTDCPTREKFGWLNDAKSSCEQFLMDFDTLTFWQKWYVDIVDSIRDDGAISGIAPTSGCLFDSYTGPICTGVLFEVPYRVYLYSGDDSMMMGALDAYMKHIRFLKSMKDEDGFVGYGLYDWAGPFENQRSAPTPVQFTDTALYIEFLKRALFATARANRADLERELCEELQLTESVFRKRYLLPDGRCAVDEQTAISMMIEIGIGDDIEPLSGQLKAAVERHDFHHHCGMLGIRYLYDALNRCGLEQYAYRIISAEGFPAYSQWLREGATTLWETWFPGASKNHHMYSGFMLWLMNTLIGINPDPAAPGMKRVILRPFFAEGLDHAKGSREMGEGKLCVEWRRNGARVDVDIVVPKGIEAVYEGGVLTEGTYNYTA